MFELFYVSATSVLKLVFVIMTGIYLAKRGILDASGRKKLADVIVQLLLPAMLASSLVKSADASVVWQYLPVVFGAVVIGIIGLAFSWVVDRLFRVPKVFRPLTSMASCLGNASYIPMPLFAAICATAKFPGVDAEQANLTCIMLIALFLLTHSPLQWWLIYPYLGGDSLRKSFSLRRMFNPPMLGSLAGIIIVFTPLRSLFCGDKAPLSVFMSAAELLAQGVFPGALLLLGSNLAHCDNAQSCDQTTEPSVYPEKMPLRMHVSVVVCKLILMPLAGFFLVPLLRKWGILPDDPFCSLVLMTEFAVPPATNLIIMCQAHHRGERQMARLLVASYCVSVITLTLWLTVFMKVCF